MSDGLAGGSARSVSGILSRDRQDKPRCSAGWGFRVWSNLVAWQLLRSRALLPAPSMREQEATTQLDWETAVPCLGCTEGRTCTGGSHFWRNRSMCTGTSVTHLNGRTYQFFRADSSANWIQKAHQKFSPNTLPSASDPGQRHFGATPSTRLPSMSLVSGEKVNATHLIWPRRWPEFHLRC